MKNKPNVVLDFDGVMNTYTGWQGEDELFEPREGLNIFLAMLNERYTVYIVTTRPKDKIVEWLNKYNLVQYIKDISIEKPPAVAYIDDRAILFNGDFGEVYDKLITFKAYWEK